MGIFWTAAMVVSVILCSTSWRDLLTDLEDNVEGMEGLVQQGSIVESVLYLMLMVDAVALLVAFLASGKCRDYVFRSDSTSCPHLWRCFQCLAGPCTILLLQSILAICFFMVLPLSYIVCIIAALAEGVGAVCSSESEAIQDMENVLDKLNEFGLMSIKLDLTKYCSVASAEGAHGMILFAGIFTTVVSAAGLLCCLSSYKSRVADAMFTEEKLENEKKEIADQLDHTQKSYSDLSEAEELQRSIGAELERQLKDCEKEKDAAIDKARECETEVSVLSKKSAKLEAEISELQQELRILRKSEYTPAVIGAALIVDDRMASKEKVNAEVEPSSWFSCGCEKT